jgi:hypothetical protein
MSGRTMTAVICFLAVSAMAAVSLAAGEAEQGKSASAKPVANVQLPQELSMALDDILKMVNEGKKPNKDEIAAVNDMLQREKKTLPKFDEPSKTKYHMLSAWIGYFAGDFNTAITAINNGLRNGPEDADMKATYAAIAIATEKYPMVLKLIPAKKPVKPKKKNAETEMETYTESSNTTGVLKFDMQEFRPQAINKKLSGMETTYSCIGGATIAVGKSEYLCVLAWRSTAVKDKTKGSPTSEIIEDYSSSQTTDSESGTAFGALCLEYSSSGKVSFIGANFDPVEANYNAMKEMSAKGWFWPQAMAQEPANRPLMELAKFETEKPTMAIIKKDGTIVYMGSPASFLPKMVLARATNDYVPQLYKPGMKVETDAARKKTATPADANSIRGKTGKAGEDDPTQAASDIQAETLYNHAKSFLKGSMTTSLTAGSGVPLCRQIFQQYPNTEWAAKARVLLRDLPDELKTRFNITNEEMGL